MRLLHVSYYPVPCLVPELRSVSREKEHLGADRFPPDLAVDGIRRFGALGAWPRGDHHRNHDAPNHHGPRKYHRCYYRPTCPEWRPINTVACGCLAIGSGRPERRRIVAARLAFLRPSSEDIASLRIAWGRRRGGKPHGSCPSRYASIRTVSEPTLFGGSVHYEIRLDSGY